MCSSDLIAGRTYGWVIAKNPVRIGTKYIWGNTSWQSGNAGGSSSRLLNCYDVATGAICEVIGWSVKPRPEVWSLEVSRSGTSPASM